MRPATARLGRARRPLADRDLLAATGGGPRTSATRWARGWPPCRPRPPRPGRGLVLSAARPASRTQAERAARVERDEALARSLERDGVDAFLDGGSRSRCSRRCRRARADDERAGANTVDGLASSLRLAGTGTQDPLWDRLGELTMPCSSSPAGTTNASPAAAHAAGRRHRRERDARASSPTRATRATASGARVLRRSSASGWRQGT